MIKFAIHVLRRLLKYDQFRRVRETIMSRGIHNLSKMIDMLALESVHLIDESTETIIYQFLEELVRGESIYKTQIGKDMLKHVFKQRIEQLEAVQNTVETLESEGDEDDVRVRNDDEKHLLHKPRLGRKCLH